MNNILYKYLIIINIISFISYTKDKYNAIKNKRRIKEKTLLLYTILGGISGVLAMIIFHHKTKKIKFWIINIISIIIWIYIIYLFKGVK